jgi:hypothetical protein
MSQETQGLNAELAEKIRARRNYQMDAEGVTFCDLRGCRGSSGLACYRTGVPICLNCAVKTPVGYISREAQREQANVFYDATTGDYVKTGVVAFLAHLFIGFLATRLALLAVGFLGFFGFIFVLFIAASAGSAVSEAVWRAIGRKRGRYTGQIAALGVAASAFFLVPFTPFIVLLVYSALVISTVSSRFQLGIRL